MPSVSVNGSTIVYEVMGDGPPLILTPGGRFGKDVVGLRPLAEALAPSTTVVLWDRPNTGASELKFKGESESQMAADDLAGLLKELDLGPTIVAGGSAGSRVSLIAAIRHPEVVDKLVLWSLSGGRFGTMFLAMQYLLPHIAEAWLGGMEPVTKLPDMKESIRANPANEGILLGQDRQEFIDTLTQWLSAYIPRDDQPVPGVDAADVRTVAAPTLVFRNGDGDIYHPAETSIAVQELIPGAILAEPPWGRDGWFKIKQRVAAGDGGFFSNWQLLAPAILDFALS